MAGRTLALPAAAAFAAATDAVPPPHMHQDHMYNCIGEICFPNHPLSEMYFIRIKARDIYTSSYTAAFLHPSLPKGKRNVGS